MKKILVEGFDYRDLVGQILPEIEVDEYSAKMGSDDDIVTVSFTVKGQQIAEDLVNWLERGYTWILDSQPSEGEVRPGKWLVFVEMDRRTNVPERIIQMIEDLETLTDLPVDKWTIIIDDQEYKPEVEIIKSKIILSPQLYRDKHGDEKDKDKEKSINEMKNLSGIIVNKKFANPDKLLKDFIAKAGL
jgi:hypothetical protein